MTPIETYNHILGQGNAWLQIPFISAGIFLGGRSITSEIEKWKLESSPKKQILFAAILGTLIGSTLPAFFAGDVIENRAFNCFITPKTMLGGLLGSFFAVALTKRILKINYPTSESFTLGSILMLAIGRLGCFVGHCCYGKIANWGVDFGDGRSRIPTQLIEAGILFFLFYLFKWLKRTEFFKDKTLFLFFSIYGFLRFFLEYLREPISKNILGIGFYQWLALILLVTGLFQITKRTLFLREETKIPKTQGATP